MQKLSECPTIDGVRGKRDLMQFDQIPARSQEIHYGEMFLKLIAALLIAHCSLLPPFSVAARNQPMPSYRQIWRLGI